MKTLTNFTVKEEGGKVTITADLTERTFSKIPMQQVTMLHFAGHDRGWCRHVQMSNEALFVKRFKDGLALDLEAWVMQVANLLEPKLASPPKGKNIKTTPDALKAEIHSELQPKFQWQQADAADTPSDKWQAIEGQTGDTLKLDSVKGKWVRCFASTLAGEVATPPVNVKA